MIQGIFLSFLNCAASININSHPQLPSSCVHIFYFHLWIYKKVFIKEKLVIDDLYTDNKCSSNAAMFCEMWKRIKIFE